MTDFSGEYSIGGSIPQDTAGWRVSLNLRQSGSDLSGRYQRVVEGYSPDFGSSREVTDEGSVSGRVVDGIAVLKLGTLAVGEARFRRTADGITPVHINAYHGGLDRAWTRLY